VADICGYTLARVVDKAEDAPTNDALFGESDPLLSVNGTVSRFFSLGSCELPRDELQRRGPSD
jgi:hypothetical protein